MKLRTRLLSYTAAIALSAGAAFAAIDGNKLADDYLAEGYSFVEVKVGPTQTKVEAIKGGVKVEVIYDNETLEIIKKEQEAADGDDAGRNGKDVRTVDRDFETDDDQNSDDDDDHGNDHDDDEDHDEDDDDHDDEDEDEDDDEDDEDDEDEDDDDGDDDRSRD